MTAKSEATEALETIVSLSEQVITIARDNIAKAKAAQEALPQIIEADPERADPERKHE